MPLEFFVQTIDPEPRISINAQLKLALSDGRFGAVAYTTIDGEVRVAEETTGGWVVSTPPTGVIADDDISRVSLEFDEESRLHLAFPFIHDTSTRIRYGVRDNAWSFEDVPDAAGLFADRVRFPMMALYRGFLFDQAGSESPEVEARKKAYRNSPHFCFQRNFELWHAAKLRPREFPPVLGQETQPAVWKKHVEPIDDGSPETGGYSTLNWATDDTLRIAYCDFDPNQDRRLRLATMQRPFDGPFDRPTGWQMEVLDASANCAFPSLAQTITGGGAVSYWDRPRGLKICMFGDFPESPVVEVVDTSPPDTTEWSSIALSHNQFPPRWTIAYSTGGRLKVAQRIGFNQFEINDVDTGGRCPDLAVDRDGNIHVAYLSDGVVKYASAAPEDV